MTAMQRKLFVAFILGTQGAAVIASANGSNMRVGSSMDGAVGVQHRSLTTSLLSALPFYKPRAKVKGCRGEMETDDEAGEERPLIVCEFIVPEQ